MARALVLGATGHIGAHVVRALLAEGHEVRAAYRNERFLFVLEGLPLERVRVDLESLEGLPQALKGCAWVFHAGGYYPRFRERRDRVFTTAVESTRRVFEQIRRAVPERVVFTSSSATIRRVAGRAATEMDALPWPLPAPRPASMLRSSARQAGLEGWHSLYTTAKVAMEQEALRAHEAGVPVVIVNPSICIGEYDAHQFSGRLVLAFAKYRLPWYLDRCFNVVYTGDVGVGHLRAAQRGRLGERYLLTGCDVSAKDFAGLVAAALGAQPPRWQLPHGVAVAASVVSECAAWLTRTDPLLPRQIVRGSRLDQRLDGSKALRELSLPQTPLDETVRRALVWFRQHGYLK